MSQQNRRPTAKDEPVNAAQVGNFDAQEDDGLWSEEELERASMGWRADDEQPIELDDTTPSARIDIDDKELETADDALTDMTAHELRRDQNHRSGGDDYSAGFESVIGTNGPKEDDLESKTPRGNRGKSDWR